MKLDTTTTTSIHIRKSEYQRWLRDAMIVRAPNKMKWSQMANASLSLSYQQKMCFIFLHKEEKYLINTLHALIRNIKWHLNGRSIWFIELWIKKNRQCPNNTVDVEIGNVNNVQKCGEHTQLFGLYVPSSRWTISNVVRIHLEFLSVVVAIWWEISTSFVFSRNRIDVFDVVSIAISAFTFDPLVLFCTAATIVYLNVHCTWRCESVVYQRFLFEKSPLYSNNIPSLYSCASLWAWYSWAIVPFYYTSIRNWCLIVKSIWIRIAVFLHLNANEFHFEKSNWDFE